MQDTKVESIRADVLRIEIVLPVVAFMVPLVVSGPQILTGSLVNAFLLLATMHTVSKRNQLLIAVLPSIGAVGNGLLFGKFTPFLLYMLPFIWISNLILMRVYGVIAHHHEKISAVIASAGVKAMALFISALFLYRAHIVPQALLNAMGLMQFTTALIGGLLAVLVMNYLKSHHDRR